MLFSGVAPFNMDEFSQYNALSYWLYPNNSFNIFREGIKYYDLAPVNNIFLPMMSYGYVGSVTGLIYYPLFKIWPSVYSARLMGVLYLVLQAFILSRLFKANFVFSFLFLAMFFPYAVQHMVDFGPIALSTSAVLASYYLAVKWGVSLQEKLWRSLGFSFASGFAIFLGIWAKLSFFFALPSLLALLLYEFMRQRKSISFKNMQFIISLLTFLLGAGLLPWVLLNSTQRWGSKYYSTLANAGRLNLSDTTIFFAKISKLGAYLANPLLSADRIFDISGQYSLAGIVLIATTLLILAYGAIKYRNRGFIVINFLLFLISFFLILRSADSWGMHHVVLSLPFLVLALFAVVSNLNNDKIVLVLTSIFVLTNCTLYLQLKDLPVKPYNHPGKIKLNDIITKNYDKDHVVVVVDWGMYYIKALYGNKEQCVIYIEPLNNISQINSIIEILNKTNRKALFFGRLPSNSDINLIQKSFPEIEELKTTFDSGEWRVWVKP